MVSGTVERLSYGPHGIVRVGGKVHFVRHVAPGDEVEMEVTEDHGAYAYARAVRLVRAGPARREPPCPFLPRCGGCDWQQVAYASQLAAKEEILRELVARIAGLRQVAVAPAIPAEREFGYRRRLSLRVEGRRLGYYAAASHELVPVDHCLLAAPELEGAIPIAQAWVAAAETEVRRVEIVAAGDGARFALAAQAQGPFVSGDAARAERALAREPRLAGIALRGKGWRRTFGSERVPLELPQIGPLWVRPDEFSQVSQAGNAALVQTVLRYAACGPEDDVLDLYAGAGNLSLPLALRARRVVAVERAPRSAEDGRENAQRLGLAHVDFLAADAAALVSAWAREGRKVDVVVLDPPRAGAREVVAELARLAPKRIVYASCNPATLARDLRILAQAFEVEELQPIDFFPQTHHLEVVARLRR